MKYRVWYDANHKLWCVSQDWSDGIRRRPIILCGNLDIIWKRLSRYIKRRKRYPIHVE